MQVFSSEYFEILKILTTEVTNWKGVAENFTQLCKPTNRPLSKIYKTSNLIDVYDHIYHFQQYQLLKWLQNAIIDNK